jgi:hypothetical protein
MRTLFARGEARMGTVVEDDYCLDPTSRLRFAVVGQLHTDTLRCINRDRQSGSLCLVHLVLLCCLPKRHSYLVPNEQRRELMLTTTWRSAEALSYLH